MSSARIIITLKSDCPQRYMNRLARFIHREQPRTFERHLFVHGLPEHRHLVYDWKATLVLPKRKRP